MRVSWYRTCTKVRCKMQGDTAAVGAPLASQQLRHSAHACHSPTRECFCPCCAAVVAHPVATSVVILVGSSLLLSPYILLAGIAVVAVTGTKILPGFMRPALPGPVKEVR